MSQDKKQVKKAEAKYGAPMPEMYKKELDALDNLNKSFNEIFGEPYSTEQQQQEDQQQQELEQKN